MKIALAASAALALAFAASAVGAKERFLLAFVVEQNSAVTQCAFGKLPYQYGACVQALYKTGQAKGTTCPQVRIGGAFNAVVPLTSGFGYYKLKDAEIAMLDRASEPMIELFVTGVPELVFLPKQPKGQECCNDRLVSLPRNRSLGIENDMHRLVREPAAKYHVRYTIIVPPGSCKRPVRKPGA